MAEPLQNLRFGNLCPIAASGSVNTRQMMGPFGETRLVKGLVVEVAMKIYDQPAPFSGAKCAPAWADLSVSRGTPT
ncbi:MAG: hypothetical protein HYX92_05840 [Chloroflexi bacterium]|nr:hypothetical protein [Chloroflexota bacterium]